MVHFTLSSCVRSCRPWSLALFAGLLAVILPAEAEARQRGRGQQRGRGRYVRPASTTQGKGVGQKTGFASLPGEKAFNECRKYPYYKRIKVTLKPDSELHDLVAWISGMTCKRFIVTGKVRAPKVTIISPTTITPREAYRAFLSALNAMGLTVQPAGRYLKIIELTGVGRQPVLTCAAGKRCPSDERAVTQMFRLKHVEPDDVSTVLQQLTRGSIVTYGATNLLIITDTGANIARLRRIIRELDRPAQAEKIWFIKVRHALVSDVADLALKVFPDAGDDAKSGSRQTRARRRVSRRRRRRKAAPIGSSVVKVKGGRGGPAISKIIAEERSNALVVVADDRGYLQVAAFVKRIDIPKAGGEGRLHIVKLQNADAMKLAATLSGLTQGGSRSSGSRNARGRSRTRTRRRSRPASKSRTGTVSLFSGDVQITEETATNSLLIVASTRDYLSLRTVIKQLDKPRRQVFVEATILEVSLSKQRDLGMSFHGGTTVGKGDKKSLMTFGNNAGKTLQPASVLMDPAAMMGMAAGLSGPEIKGADALLGIPGVTLPSFGVFFQALQSNDDVNLVSAPHILATDNEEAEISVGENVPFQSTVTGVPSISTGTTTTPSLTGLQSIQREDVALTLKITPYVNDSGFVRMKIEQELEEVKSIDPVVGPTVVKRKVKTMVTVRDQQTVVIGGLITNKIKRFVQKVPVLGDIPILGYLFKSTVKIVEKTNLLIFLTPYVVRDQSDLRRIFQRKIQQRREFIERYTAFANVDYEAVVDYSHKRGLIAEIDRVTRISQQEARLRSKALEASRDRLKEGLLEVDPRDLKRIRR